MSEVINHPISDVFTFYADDHLENHPRWDHEMQLSQVSDGEVGVGTVFKRLHTHYGDPVEGSMTFTRFERDEALAFTINDGGGDWYGRMSFEAIADSKTRVSISVDLPGRPETADNSLLRKIGQRWLDTEDLI